MRKLEKPSMEVIELRASDVIATSGCPKNCPDNCGVVCTNDCDYVGIAG